MEDHYKVLYDYDAQRNDELSLQVGDMVRILQSDNGEWCTAENLKTSQQGLVPTNFLEKVEPNSASMAGVNDGGPVLATVLQDYAAQDHDELSLWKNGVVTVLDQSIADGWWKGDLNGKTGVFPANHVKLIDAHEQVPDVDENDKNRRQSFKLAAYGVKQGGIGSILAGGFSLKKKGPKKEEATSTQQQQPQSQQHPTEQAGTRTNDNNEMMSPDGRENAMVVSAYDPQNDDELQLIPGAYVTITDKLDNEGWWKGLNEKNEEGLFPSNFVQILSSDAAPARPARARPPTIKTDTPQTTAEQQQQKQQPVLSPTGMAKPPPVPVGTRPSSLLTRRPTGNSEQAAPPLPRPITSPPISSARRANSVIKDSNTQPQQSHKRTPSIPLMSPDLPPIRQDQQHSHDQHAVRPSRPVPSPGSAAIGSNVTSPTSPTSEERTAGLAKVPKNFGKHPTGPIPPPRTSRPNSQASSVNTITTDASPLQTIPDETNDEADGDNNASPAPPMPPPRVPKRSMPPVPHPTHAVTEESPAPRQLVNDSNNKNNNKGESTKLTSSSASSSSSSSSSTSFTSPISAATTVPPKKHADHPPHSDNDDNNPMDTTNPLEMKLRRWFKKEVEAMRSDFESQLEEERAQRMKLEMELESLKRQLS